MIFLEISYELSINIRIFLVPVFLLSLKVSPLVNISPLGKKNAVVNYPVQSPLGASVLPSYKDNLLRPP